MSKERACCGEFSGRAAPKYWPILRSRVISPSELRGATTDAKKKEPEMNGPYGFDPSEHCQNCKQKREGFFCQFSAAALKDFDEMRSSAIYPEGALLFLEKQDPRGVFVLCAGEVKLSISSSGGKTLILRIAKPGEVLGLMSTMSDAPYEVTAETIRPCQVAYIRRKDFLRFT